VIGYYVHHQGRGHLHRAQALAEASTEPVTGRSSLPRPAAWVGSWVQLPQDDAAPSPQDVTAGGALHWVPRRDTGLRARSAAVSAWIEEARPRAVVVDVSVEVALLVRLHGVPVVSVLLPGERTDPPHLLGFRASEAVVTFSAAPAAEVSPGLPDDVASRVMSLGAVSRFPVATSCPPDQKHAVVLLGQGGSAPRLPATPGGGWTWTVLGGPDTWVDDPSPFLHDADVVVTQAGESALADVAAHRRPAVVVPSDRPHGEQEATAALLSRGPWPAVVVPRFPSTGWAELLEQAAALDGRAWSSWCDGRAAERFADVVAEVSGRPGSRCA
jgi:hypothetical protein